MLEQLYVDRCSYTRARFAHDGDIGCFAACVSNSDCARKREWPADAGNPQNINSAQGFSVCFRGRINRASHRLGGLIRGTVTAP
jgi:hypothetical protein